MSRHSVHDDLDEFDDSGPSKTEQKKAMERLQALGERLAGLGTQKLKKMPISETLFLALEELKRLKAHEAVRRQKQYIGKLMREENEEAILNVLNPLANPLLNKLNKNPLNSKAKSLLNKASNKPSLNKPNNKPSLNNKLKNLPLNLLNLNQRNLLMMRMMMILMKMMILWKVWVMKMMKMILVMRT